MEVKKGKIRWASTAEPQGPGFRRPVVVAASNDFNQSRIPTIVCLVISANLKLASAPGNFRLPKFNTGLDESVVNVSQVITLDKSLMSDSVGKITARQLNALYNGLKLVLAIYI